MRSRAEVYEQCARGHEVIVESCTAGQLQLEAKGSHEHEPSFFWPQLAAPPNVSQLLIPS